MRGWGGARERADALMDEGVGGGGVRAKRKRNEARRGSEEGGGRGRKAMTCKVRGTDEKG